MSRQRAVWMALIIFVGLVSGAGAAMARPGYNCTFSREPCGPAYDTLCFVPTGGPSKRPVSVPNVRGSRPLHSGGLFLCVHEPQLRVRVLDWVSE